MGKESYLTRLAQAMREKGCSENDINLCVEYSSGLIRNNLPVIFDLKHLSLMIGIDSDKICSMVFGTRSYYHKHNIPKKNNKTRTIDSPTLELKNIQKWILNEILNNIRISEFATGFTKGKSIIDNATIHLHQACILNIDIKDFFPSITFLKVYKIFRYYGYTKEVSFLLSKLCTLENKLPQGSPASPALSNIVCLKLDKRLYSLAQKYSAKYSRYADDITFSGNKQISNIMPACVKILEEEDFVLNDRKTRQALSHQHQEVTGIVINNGTLKVPKRYKRGLLQEIYYCSKYGVNSHLEKIGSNKAFYKEHLYGKAYFVKMVNAEEGETILKILDQLQWNY